MTRAIHDFRADQSDRGQFYDKLPAPDFQPTADRLWTAAQKLSIAEPDQVRLHRQSLLEAQDYIATALTNAGISQ